MECEFIGVTFELNESAFNGIPVPVVVTLKVISMYVWGSVFNSRFSLIENDK